MILVVSVSSSSADDLEVSEETPIDRSGTAAGASSSSPDGAAGATQKKTRKVDRATEERDRERNRKQGMSIDPKRRQHVHETRDDDRYTMVARKIRVAVSPYLPPPVVNGIALQSDPFLRPYAGEEGTTKVVLSILVAYVTKRVVQFVASRLLGKGRAVQQDPDHPDAVLAASNRRAHADYDQTVVICGPSSSGKTRLLYHLCYNENVDTVESVKVNVIISDRTRYMDWPGIAKLNSDGFKSVLRQQGRPPLIVLVVDSTQPVAMAADCMHQLFSTCSATSSAGPLSVLVLCHKSDLPTAKNPKRVQLQLRGELERLLKSSAAKGASGGTSSTTQSTSPPLWWLVGEPVDFEALKFVKLMFRPSSCEGKGCRDLVSEFVRTGSLAD